MTSFLQLTLLLFQGNPDEHTIAEFAHMIKNLISEYTKIHFKYFQVPNTSPPPPAKRFSIFFIPQTLLGSPFINFEENEAFTNSLLYLLSLLVLFKPIFEGKIACFCMHFSSLLYDNLVFLLPPLFNNCKAFLKLRTPPPFVKFQSFFQLPFLGPGHPIYVALESMSAMTHDWSFLLMQAFTL